MGRGATISIAKRAAIVTLKEEGYSVRSIAGRVGVSRAAVGKLCQRKINCNTIQPQKSPGRPRKTSKQTDCMIRRQAVANPGVMSYEISATIPITLSGRSIRRRLQEMHLNGRRPATRTFLNKVQKQKRVVFSRLHGDKSAEWWMQNVLFSDESMVELHSPACVLPPSSSLCLPTISPSYEGDGMGLFCSMWCCCLRDSTTTRDSQLPPVHPDPSRSSSSFLGLEPNNGVHAGQCSSTHEQGNTTIATRQRRNTSRLAWKFGVFQSDGEPVCCFENFSQPEECKE